MAALAGALRAKMSYLHRLNLRFAFEMLVFVPVSSPKGLLEGVPSNQHALEVLIGADRAVLSL